MEQDGLPLTSGLALPWGSSRVREYDLIPIIALALSPLPSRSFAVLQTMHKLPSWLPHSLPDRQEQRSLCDVLGGPNKGKGPVVSCVHVNTVYWLEIRCHDTVSDQLQCLVLVSRVPVCTATSSTSSLPIMHSLLDHSLVPRSTAVV